MPTNVISCIFEDIFILLKESYRFIPCIQFFRGESVFNIEKIWTLFKSDECSSELYQCSYGTSHEIEPTIFHISVIQSR
jgi:hypothetical protein